MSNTNGFFQDNLSRVVQASRLTKSIRACLLTTRDREQAIAKIIEVATASKIPLFHSTIAFRQQYLYDKLQWDKLGQGNPDPTALFEQAATTKGGGIFIFEDSIPLLRDEGGDRNARMKLAELITTDSTRNGAVLLFIEAPETEQHLPGMLDDQIIRLDIPYPRTGELEQMARAEIASLAYKAGEKIDTGEIKTHAKELSDTLVSLTLSAARDALRDSLSSRFDMKNAKDYLQVRKSERLSRELSMQVLDTNVEDPIGLDNLVDYLNIHKDKMRLNGKSRARGILLVGPPGTGKTMLAQAIGKITKLPVVAFRLSSLMNSLLGETERKFSQAFATLEAMAPNIVFIDEIEKAFGDSSERDGGTMMRCTGSLLSWLSDNPYPNFIVATANNMARMGEIGLTMTRSERFDTAFFVDVPSRESRVLMLNRWLPPSLANNTASVGRIADLTDKFSGADVRSVIKQSVAKAEFLKTQPTLDLIIGEINLKRPRIIALYDEFSRLRKWGKTFCEPASIAEY